MSTDDTPLTQAELAQWRADAEKATQEPWLWERGRNDEGRTIIGVGPAADVVDAVIAELKEDDEDHARHIANASPHNLLRLLKEHERMREEHAELRSALQLALRDLEGTYSHVSSVSADRIKTVTIPRARSALGGSNAA